MLNHEAETIARALVEMGITRFGCPVSLHSDNGTNFISELLCELRRILGIDRISTISFHLEGNATIERTNKTLEESLSKLVLGHQHERKIYHQLVLTAFRSFIYAVTKYNRSYVVRGKLLRLSIV